MCIRDRYFLFVVHRHEKFSTRSTWLRALREISALTDDLTPASWLRWWHCIQTLSLLRNSTINRWHQWFLMFFDQRVNSLIQYLRGDFFIDWLRHIVDQVLVRHCWEDWLIQMIQLIIILRVNRVVNLAASDWFWVDFTVHLRLAQLVIGWLDISC